MRNYVIINGVNSLTIQGLAIKTMPPITKPIQRNLREEIDGRDGDIVTPLGYGAYDKTIEIGLFGTFDIDEVIAYFNQKGTITFSNEADKVYYFEALDQVDYAELLKFRTANVVLHCQPFKYPTEETPLEEEYEYVTGTGTNITLDNTEETEFNEIELQGNTSQVTYTGVNLLDVTHSTTNVLAGITSLTKGNNYIDGTTSATEWAGLQLVTTLEAGTYYYKHYTECSDTANSNGLGTFRVNKDSQSGTPIINQNVGTNVLNQINSASFTITEAGTYVFVYRYGNATAKVRHIIIKDIILSKTDEDYQPYVGATSSPNPNYPQDVRTINGDNQITICSDNLLDTSSMVKGDLQNETGKEVVQTGTTHYRSGFIGVKPSTQYTFTTDYTYTGTGITKLMEYDKDKNFIRRNGMSSTNKVIPFTTSATTEYLRVAMYSNASFTDFYSLKNMVIKGTSSTYKAYEGETYPLSLGVENLITKGTQLNGCCNISSLVFTQDASAVGYYFKTSELPSTMTFTSENGNRSTIAYFNEIPAVGVAAIKRDATEVFPKTIQVDHSYPYAHIQFSYGVQVTGIQMTQGTTIQRISTQPIEMARFDDNTYDYFYKEEDKWYKKEVIKKAVLTGSNYNGKGTTGTNAYYLNVNLQTKVDNTKEMIKSNKFAPISFNNRANGKDVTYSQNGDVTLRTRNNTPIDWSTPTKASEWLDNNTPIIYYILATANDLEITDETLTDQLEAIWNATSYRGQTNITQVSNDLPFMMEVSALKLGSDHLEINNTGNIYSKPTIELEGTGIVDIYLNDVQVFEVDLSEENKITIDTEKMEAYTDTGLANRKVTGDYSTFKLNVGTNDLRFSGALTSATITRYLRWL